VSRYGLVAYGSSLDTVGVFAQSARDLALVFQVIAGHDPKDATTLDEPVPAFLSQQRRDAKGIRIGIPEEYFIKGIQAEVETGVRQAVEVFRGMGAEVKPVNLPHTEYAVPVYYLIAPAEASANLARYDGIRYGPREEAENILEVFCKTRGRRFGAEVKRRIMLGTYALSAGYYDAYYGQAQKVRTLIQADFKTAFDTVDVIAAPVAPSTAFRLGEHSDDPLAMYLEDVFTLPANLAGIPGIAFPVGFDNQGLPLGIQLMGPGFSEPRLIQMADAYQQATDWHLQIPPIARGQDDSEGGSVTNAG
jgi:aspartyl-tRNA(Asn)/glutamyl-tRNA(Gln) amidotransferase subunit A